MFRQYRTKTSGGLGAVLPLVHDKANQLPEQYDIIYVDDIIVVHISRESDRLAAEYMISNSDEVCYRNCTVLIRITAELLRRSCGSS